MTLHYLRLRVLQVLFFIILNLPLVFGQAISEKNGEFVVEYNDGSFRPIVGNVQDKQLLLAYLKEKNPDEPNEILHILQVEKICQYAQKQRIQLQQEEIIQNRQLVESDLKTAKSEKNEENITVLSKILNEVKSKEKKISDELKEKSKSISAIDKQIIQARAGKPVSKEQFGWVNFENTASAKVEEAQSNPIENVKPSSEPIENKTTETVSASKKTSFDEPSLAYKTISNDENVLLTPPKRRYTLVFDGKEEFTGKSRKDLEKDILFVHTDDILKNVMKNKEYITAEAYLSQIPGYKMLNLMVTIQSENAPKQFGAINKGSSLILKLINGEAVRINALNYVPGTVVPVDGTTIYHAQYIINSEDEKLLQKWELDKMRIIWSTGYEEYEVTEMDFFINQLASLK